MSLNPAMAPAPLICRPADLVIRATRIGDYESLAALPGFRAGTLRLPFQSPDQTRKWLETQKPDDLSIVALREGSIVGSAGWSRHPGRRSHAAGIGIGVHDDFHGQGIGTRLLAELVDAADNWFCLRRLELTVLVDNAAAIHLYRKFGFAVEGTHVGYAFAAGRHVDALAMARLRPAGA